MNAWLPSGGSEDPYRKYKLCWMLLSLLCFIPHWQASADGTEGKRHPARLARPSISVPLSFPKKCLPLSPWLLDPFFVCAFFGYSWHFLLFFCLGSHHFVLILLQPGALSSGWQARTLLRGANQLRQKLEIKSVGGKSLARLLKGH